MTLIRITGLLGSYQYHANRRRPSSRRGVSSLTIVRHGGGDIDIISTARLLFQRRNQAEMRRGVAHSGDESARRRCREIRREEHAGKPEQYYDSYRELLRHAP